MFLAHVTAASDFLRPSNGSALAAALTAALAIPPPNADDLAASHACALASRAFVLEGRRGDPGRTINGGGGGGGGAGGAGGAHAGVAPTPLPTPPRRLLRQWTLAACGEASSAEWTWEAEACGTCEKLFVLFNLGRAELQVAHLAYARDSCCDHTNATAAQGVAVVDSASAEAATAAAAATNASPTATAQPLDPSHRAAVQALQRAASAFHFLASDVCRAGCFVPPSIALLAASLERAALCAVQEIALRRGAAVQLSPKLLARLSVGLRDRYDGASRLSAMAGAPGGSLHAVCLDASLFWQTWGGNFQAQYLTGSTTTLVPQPPSSPSAPPIADLPSIFHSMSTMAHQRVVLMTEASVTVALVARFGHEAIHRYKDAVAAELERITTSRQQTLSATGDLAAEPPLEPAWIDGARNARPFRFANADASIVGVGVGGDGDSDGDARARGGDNQGGAPSDDVDVDAFVHSGAEGREEGGQGGQATLLALLQREPSQHGSTLALAAMLAEEAVREDTGGGIVGIVGSGGRHGRHGRDGASPRRALAGYKSAIRWLMIAYKARPDKEILRQMTQYLRRAEYLEETLAAAHSEAHSEVFKDSENSEYSEKSGTSDGLGTPGDPAASASGTSAAGGRVDAATIGVGGQEAKTYHKTVDECQTDLAASAEVNAEIGTEVGVGTLDGASSDGVGNILSLAVAVEGALPNSSSIYAPSTVRADNSVPGAPQLVTATCSSLTIQWTAPTVFAPARGGGGEGEGGGDEEGMVGASAITVLYEVSWRRIWGSEEGSEKARGSASGSGGGIASSKRAGSDTGNSGATGNAGDAASPHHAGRWHRVPHPIVGSDSDWRHPMYTLNLLRQAAAEQYQVSTRNVCCL